MNSNTYAGENNTWLFWPTIVVLAAIYIWFRSTHFTFGDSTGLFMMADEGYSLSTNAGDHFLWMNSLHFILQLFPWDLRFDVALFYSIFWSIATAILLYHTVKKLTGNVSAALLTMVIFGLSFTNWKQSEIIEVYTLNNFLCLGYLSLIFLDLKENKASRHLWIGLIYGFSWYSHIGNTLLGPVMALYAWHIYQIRGLSVVIRTAAVSVLMVSGLFILPLILDTHPLSYIFTAGHFEDEIMATGIGVYIRGFLQSIAYFIYNFGPFGLLLIHGIVLLFRENKKMFWAAIIGVIPTWIFAMRYQVSDNYVFFLPAYLILMIASGYSLNYWLKKIKAPAIALLAIALIIFPLQYYAALKIAEAVPQTQSYQKLKEYKGGLRYHMWPGMRNNVDILEKTREVYYNGKPYPHWLEDMGWNYVSTMQYLDYIGEVDLKQLDTLQDADIETKPMFREGK